MQETHPDHDKVSLERSTFFNSLLEVNLEISRLDYLYTRFDAEWGERDDDRDSMSA